jgi:hypothetical protein
MAGMPIYSPGSGFGQGTYSDQMGTQLPGMLANASDINLADSASLTATGTLSGGLAAGSLCYMGYTSGGKSGGRAGSNSMVASATAITPISWGVIIRTQQMRTNAGGLGCVADGDMATLLRSDRVGGRVWVLCTSTNIPAVGARSCNVVDNKATLDALMLTTGTGTAIDHIIVHAIDTLGAYTVALIEFTTKS